jgi:phosphoadenosine phosphosulfate reductase
MALQRHRGRIAVLSSFGADAAVLLSLVADLDRHTPVLFLQTGRHFTQTLAYRNELANYLNLSDVRDLSPTGAEAVDADEMLWYDNPDACCTLRKVRPLHAALADFDAWVTGRKRYQSKTRRQLSFVEQDGDRWKINPLADWTEADIAQAFVRRGLPPHPLVAAGYRSIGCAPCTRSVRANEPARGGRWSHAAKIECGIHQLPNHLAGP